MSLKDLKPVRRRCSNPYKTRQMPQTSWQRKTCEAAIACVTMYFGGEGDYHTSVPLARRFAALSSSTPNSNSWRRTICPSAIASLFVE